MRPPADDGTHYGFPLANLAGDYIRSAIGFLLLLAPTLYSFDSHWIVSLILLSLLFLFGSFGVVTAIKQYSAIVVSFNKIEIFGPRGKSIAWTDHPEIQLKYYSTSRDKAKGWYQVNIKSGATSMKIDSSLHDFHDFMVKIARAINQNQIVVGPLTQENFSSMGIDLDGAG